MADAEAREEQQQQQQLAGTPPEPLPTYAMLPELVQITVRMVSC